jgi:predicted nucleotide-binding protein
MFTQIDKIAKLRRLVKQIDEWDSQRTLRDYGPVFQIGNPALSIDSADFQGWRDKVTATITLIFGEHSHYIDDFNEISYADIMAMLSGTPQTRLWKGLAQAKTLLQTMIEEVQASQQRPSVAAKTPIEYAKLVKQCVFIGHGRSPLWARLKLHLQDELGLHVVHFESESRTGESAGSILTEMLSEATFAILILTGEDETASGSMRARQNVIHEVGLFQSKLGFNKAILLRQEGVEDFTNLAGLQYIPFSDNKIEQAFYELGRTLKKEGLIS